MNILKNLFSKYAELSSVTRRTSEQHFSNQFRKTVLIVDDSKTAQATIKKMLIRCNFNCFVASDALDGIIAAEQLNPDLILMDVEMPGMNGFQATRALREQQQTRDIPVIIISGTVTPVEQTWGRKIGANGFLPKPMNERAFLALAEELIYTKLPKVS